MAPQIPLLPPQGMQGGCQGDIRADHHIVANLHRAGIQNGEVEIGEDARAKLSEAPIVEVDGPHEVDVLTMLGHQIVQKPATQVPLLLRRSVEKAAKLVGLDSQLAQFWI